MGTNVQGLLVLVLSRFIAVVAALYAAFALDLPNPWWAMLTVFLAQPPQALTGAIWAKAFYRLAGTLLGMAGSILIIPNLQNAPELLILAVALWAASCLYAGLLDRTPRSSMFLLAGYTVALIGLPTAAAPTTVFDVALARAEEIGIGVLASAGVQSVIAPRSVAAAAVLRLNSILDDAGKWLASSLRRQATGPFPKQLAAELTALNLMGTDWRFEGTLPPPLQRALRGLEQRMMVILPLLSACTDRMNALSPELVRTHVAPITDQIADWIRAADAGDAAFSSLLLTEVRTLHRPLQPDAAWNDILLVSLAARLEELVTVWREVRRLADAVAWPSPAKQRAIGSLVTGARQRTLHIDRGVALLSAATIAFVVIAGAVFTVSLRWESGPLAIAGGAVICSLFSTADDPTPMVRDFIVGAALGFPLAFVYEFALLPAIDGFVELSAALFPVVAGVTVFLGQPKRQRVTLAVIITFSIGLALQPKFVSDLPTLANIFVAVMVGGLLALAGLALVRIVPTQVVVRRILRSGWRELARLAVTARAPMSQAAWASRMLDRVGLLVPRLAQAGYDDGAAFDQGLRDLRIGADIIELRQLRPSLPEVGRGPLDSLMDHLCTHFRRLRGDGEATLEPAALGDLELLLSSVLRMGDAGDRLRGVVAAVDLRGALFPGAGPYSASGARP